MDILVVALASFVTVLAYMTVWFFAGKKLGRLDVADTAWGGGFIVIASTCLILKTDNRSVLIWTLVMLWGLRLAAHIWHRNIFKGPDKRYDELSSSWPKEKFWRKAYLSVFLTQAVLIFIVALPITIASGEMIRPLGVISYIAVVLWAIGFLFESVADWQLSRFIRQPSNKGQLMTGGLWRYSRHPNYFGELMQWWAISLIALGPAAGWLGLIGPALLTYLIIYVSGIPLLEKRHAKKPGYTSYKKRTSTLIPLPPKA